VILAVFTALMIVDIILWCTSGSSSGNRMNFPGGTRPEMSTSSDGSEGSTRKERSTSEGGSNRPERSTSEDGSDSSGRKRPEGFDGSNMPDFDSSNLPEGFDGSNMPSFDGSGRPSMPGNFDSSNLPEGFDGSNIPNFDSSNLPEGLDGSNMPNFDSSNLPEGFDAGNIPGDFDAGSLPEGFSRSSKSDSWLSKLYLPVLIGCIVMDIFALVMLIPAIRHNKKNGSGDGPEGGNPEDGDHSGPVDTENAKKNKALARKIIAVSVVAMLAALSIVLIVLTKKKEASDDSVRADESIMEASAKTASMAHIVTAGGSISGETEVEEYYPSGLEITDYLVSEGDTVNAGDPVAEVDRVSVMNTIAEIQDVIASLDSRLEELSGEKSDELLTTATGRIKKIYAEAGKTVVDVVKENGALMLLSLDGNMAVDIETDEDFNIGEKVNVTLGEETVTGSVEALKEEMVTFTIDDEYGSLGEEVSVAKDEKTIGKGELYIHQELAITGYEGIIDEVSASENDMPEKGDCVIRLKNETYSAEYEMLLKQREKLLSQMQSMFELYQSGVITAANSGEVTSLQDLAAATGSIFDDVTVEELSNSPTGEDDSAYTNFAVLITAVDESEFQIKMSANPIGDIDLTMVDAIGKAICTNAGTVEKSQFKYVYGYNGTEWVPQSVDDIKEGEIIVVSFDSEGNTVWAVRAEKSSETEDTTIPQNPDKPGKQDDTKETDDPGKEGSGEGTEGDPTKPEGEEGSTGEEGSGDPERPGRPEGTTENPGESGETENPEGTGTSESPEGSGSQGKPGGSGSEGRSGGSGSSGFPSGSGSSGFPSGSGSSSLPGSFSGGSGTDSSVSMPEITTGKDSSSKETVYAVEEVSVIGITPTDTVDIIVTVDELDITNIAVGQSCEVTFDAISAKSYEGNVKAIDTTGENDGGNTKYTVTVTVKREENMYTGMNTHITFSYGGKDDAKVIPESALYEEGGKTYVYTGYDKEKDELTGKTEVTTGLADGENVEILSGLSEDDKVYYRYADSLTINQAVR